eukprot:1761061-Rhodomonas_salina.5
MMYHHYHHHRCRYVPRRLSACALDRSRGLQMIFLSATVPNIEDLARWIDAQLFVTDFRPVPLTEHLVVNREILNPVGASVRTLAAPDPVHSDPDGIVCLCSEALQ